MKIEVLKRNKEWVVEFSFGNQFFTLQYGGTKAEATWMARMLNKCFQNYAKSTESMHLDKPNGLLRSTSEIAKRNGEKTNWPPFKRKLKKE